MLYACIHANELVRITATEDKTGNEDFLEIMVNIHAS